MFQLSHHARLETEASQLWQAFTSPSGLAAWLWPDRRTEVTIDLRVGGAWRAASSNLAIGVGGRYTEITVPHQLGFTWSWHGEPEVTQVSVEFTGVGLVLEHHGFGSARSRDDHIEGWRDCLARLPAFLASRPQLDVRDGAGPNRATWAVNRTGAVKRRPSGGAGST